MDKSATHKQHPVSYCIEAIRYWFNVNTLPPLWLYKGLRHRFIGYVVAVCLQVAMVVVVAESIKIDSTFRFSGLLAMLMVVVLALNWGPAPGLIATCIGTILLYFFVLPSYLTSSIDKVADIISVLLFFLVGIFTVVNASKRERVRRHAERLGVRLEAVIESIPDAVGIYDANGIAVKLNKAARHIVASKQGTGVLMDAPGTYNLRYTTGEALTFDQLPIVQALQHGEVVSAMEFIYRDGEGQDHHISMSAAPFYDAKGKLEGVVGITYDISPLRQAEREARARARELEEFISIASHELRTPLTTIKTAIQLVQRWAKDIAVGNDTHSDKFEAMNRLLERADRQVGTLNRLIGDLLDVSRIQANKLSIQTKVCDLTEIVRDVVNEQRQAVKPRPILLHLAEDCETVPVLADPERIAQVVMNYLTNALKYSAIDRAVSVSVSLEEEKCVRVAVRDEGPGLSSQEQERIWERFQQIERIKSPGNHRVGLGLGLYISRMIIARHNGQVGVESVLGEGSTFWFTLPRRESA